MMTPVYALGQRDKKMLNEALKEDLQCLESWLRGKKLSVNVIKIYRCRLPRNKRKKSLQKIEYIFSSLFSYYSSLFGSLIGK